MILGFTDLELALSDLNGVISYLDSAQEEVPEGLHDWLESLRLRSVALETELLDLYDRVEGIEYE